MEPKVEITRLGEADLPRVEALARRIWPECFADLLGAERIAVMLDAIYTSSVLASDMRDKGHVFWLAQVGGRDAGFAAAYVEGGRVWIRKLYVLDCFRGSGLGKKLIATALAFFPPQGALALNVNAGNRSAIAFYRSQGFETEQKVPVVMGPFAFEDYIMVKPLASPSGG